MNAVEIEQAITELADQPFDATAFPFAFLAAFGNKDTTIRRLQTGSTNKSDIDGVLQTGHIHLKIAELGKVSEALVDLRNSPATQHKRHKVRYILATDGGEFEAEDLTTGETVVCPYTSFPDHFGFFLHLAGITTVKQIRDSAFDIRATSRLNRLYVTLLQDNPDWSAEGRRHDMNHFMARLIFCFFAEDTDIFNGEDLFTATIAQMSERDSSNTHAVISEIFRAMNTKATDRDAANLPRWADGFPYVNGGLFSGSTEVPRFSRIAQRYLLHIGSLDWTQINPDIFGSMIQAVADEEEREALGMHYTSVPNILRVLNPLFLNDLRASLEEAGDNPRKLLNLRKRMSKIRLFDPACGSGNFLVIAYKKLRDIEAKVNERRGERERPSDISIQNFRGIELRDFSAEIARLALIIAEFQCDVLYRGPKEAKAAFLPLDTRNWITRGNALRLDWLSICPPTGTRVKMQSDDLFGTPLDQAEIDFENEGGETYICGNPPYLGSTWQSQEKKEELRKLFDGRCAGWKSLDYVAGWFLKAADYGKHTKTVTALVATNSICQGQQVPALWPLLNSLGQRIQFAHTSFKWANLASHNAGVTVIIVGMSDQIGVDKQLFSETEDGETTVKSVPNINAYLVPGPDIFVSVSTKVLSGASKMDNGNKAVDGGHLLLEPSDVENLGLSEVDRKQFVRRFVGSAEAISGKLRYCLWITDETKDRALTIPSIARRVELVRKTRLDSTKKMTQASASYSHAFQQVRQRGDEELMVVPSVSSENREYLPVIPMETGTIISHKCFSFYDAPMWNMALVASRLHWVWIGTVCVRLEMRFSYSNTLGWNTFPVPKLTEKNRADLTRSAEDILLTREAHFPATIAELYDPEKMPDDLRAAHDRNDDVLERIYIGRHFRNDTERLEKLFDMYTKMTTKVSAQ